MAWLTRIIGLLREALDEEALVQNARTNLCAVTSCAFSDECWEFVRSDRNSHGKKHAANILAYAYELALVGVQEDQILKIIKQAVEIGKIFKGLYNGLSI